ncbi:MAG: acyltransferase [Pseudomonadota bacterium]
MGTLRAIFAISVVFAHSGWLNGYVFVGGRNAVQLFYIISGFLISYVLTHNKIYRNPIKFYASRVLRLYPIYYLVAVLSLVAIGFGSPKFFDLYRSVPYDAKALLTAVNVLLFGQDWVMFLGVDKAGLVFSPDPTKSDVLLRGGLLVPQAWTLGIELSFYLIAPFILRDKRIIFFLLALSLLSRVIWIESGPGLQDPWTYRFFPFELALFLVGALSHQFALPFWEKRQKNSEFKLDTPATFLLISLSVCFFMIPLSELYKTVILFMVFPLLLPLAFIFQNNHSLDKAIGELSYPIYIGHLLVIWVINYLSKKMAITDAFILALANVLCSIVFAILLDRFVARKIERVRNRIKSSTQPFMAERGLQIEAMKEMAAK